MVPSIVSIPPNASPQAVRGSLTIGEAHKKYSLPLADNGRTPKEDRIGEGSFGMVFRGKLAGSNERVVIKIQRCAKDDKIGPRNKITRLLREVLVWSSLDHRNVAAFYGLDFSGVNIQQLMNVDASDFNPESELQVPGLVSPYLEFNILDYVAEHPYLREACVIGLARGLTYLHTERYAVHGDLRPDNIRVDSDGVVKIIDFGFSNLSHCSGFTTRGYTSLDPRFAAPEILFPEPANAPTRPTPNSDVYGFSMCMLQLLAHPDNPHSSMPFNHIPDSESPWPLIQAVRLEGRPRRDNYTKAITDLHWNVMTDCWGQSKDNRPGIHQVFEDLSGNKCAESQTVCWL